MSLLDTLLDHKFPSRGSHSAPTAQTASTRTTTTTVDIDLVAACVRAAAADPHDPHPSITIEQDDGPLEMLSSALDHHLLCDSAPPPAFSAYLPGTSTQVIYDTAVDEPQHYPLLKSVFGILCQLLFEAQDIYISGRVPTWTTWELARNPYEGGGNGRTDLEAIRLASTSGRERAGILWEYKRDLVLDLNHLLALVAAAMRPRGLRLSLDERGRPMLDDPELSADSALYDHLLKWCCQIVLEMDTNRASTAVLSSWDNFLLFHRVSSSRIFISKVIPRDRNHTGLRNPHGRLFTTVQSDWSPLKLVYSLLLDPVQSEKIPRFIQPSLNHLTEVMLARQAKAKASENRKGKGKRTREEGVEREEEVQDDCQVVASEASSIMQALVDLPFIMRLAPSDFQPRFDLIPLGFDVQPRHQLLRRDWSRTSWTTVTTTTTLYNTSNDSPITPIRSSYPTSIYPSPSDSTTSASPSLSSDKSSTSISPPHPIAPPTPAPEPVLPPLQTELRLDHYLSSGRLADTFTASFSSSAVVVKLIDLDSFTTVCPDGYDLHSATKALLNEIKLYLTHLAPLQGKIVPRLHALYLGHSPDREHEVVMMVLEHVGETIAEDWNTIPAVAKPLILSAYEALHETGIIHSDLGTRHIRFQAGPEGGLRLRLIDFEGSKYIGTKTAEASPELEGIRLLLEM